jgi:hypothetical protein
MPYQKFQKKDQRKSSVRLSPKATIGGNGSRMGEQSTNVERMVNVSRIIYTSVGGITEWIYDLVDRFEQHFWLVLSPESFPTRTSCLQVPQSTPPPP